MLLLAKTLSLINKKYRKYPYRKKISYVFKTHVPFLTVNMKKVDRRTQKEYYTINTNVQIKKFKSPLQAKNWNIIKIIEKR